MFTGLVQSIGMLAVVDPEHVKIWCSSADNPILTNLEIGDSVAVDGVCLTVERMDEMGFLAGISPETLKLTTLGQGYGDRSVNLETSLRVGGKLGGHFVTGHVDGVGHLKSSMQTATSWEMTFTTEDPQVSSYVLRKGSVAVNGISLTIAACDEAGSWFTVAVIPHTYGTTNLALLEPGSVVNLEGDILGKYVQKFLASPQSSGSPGLTSDFLAEHGYL
jgi:riboflavin synthase